MSGQEVFTSEMKPPSPWNGDVRRKEQKQAFRTVARVRRTETAKVLVHSVVLARQLASALNRRGRWYGAAARIVASTARRVTWTTQKGGGVEEGGGISGCLSGRGEDKALPHCLVENVDTDRQE